MLSLVGTPHLGAPKALSALLDNYYLIGDRDSPYLQRMVNSTVAKNLNDYGGTFLALMNCSPRLSPDCSAKWTNPPVILKVQGADHPVKNIFLVDLWKNYNSAQGSLCKRATK